jgi:hypothetical protein
MYGKWVTFVFAGCLIVLLGIALIATAYAPIFAVVIALLVAFAIVYGLSTQRTKQVGSEHAAAAQERREADQGGRPSATGAPASGEGSP